MTEDANNAIRVKLQLEINEFNKKLGMAKTNLRSLTAKGGKPHLLKGTEESIASLQVQVKTLNRQFNDVGKTRTIPFAGYAMSLMFAGMQIKMMFEGLAKSAIATFQDISHSVEGNVTNMDMLTAEWTYLKFTVGEALEPVVGFLIPIISAIADWVSENQALAAGLIASGIALGSFLFFGGQAVLAMNGFIELFSRLGIVALNAQGAVVGFSAAAKASLGALVWPLLLGVLAAAAVYKSLRDTPEAMESVKTSLGKLKEPIKNLWDSLQNLVGSFFGMEKGSSSVAWAFAWMVELAVSQFKGLLAFITLITNSLSALVSSIRAVTLAWAAMWAAVKGDEKGEKAYWRQVDADMAKMKKSLGDVKDSWAELRTEQDGYMTTLLDGPSAFKEAQLQLQGPNASYVDDVQASFVERNLFTPHPQYVASTMPPNFQPNQGNPVYITGTINIQANNTEEILASFRSLAQ